ncbi:small membrane protein YldA, partial [Klebsiella aerogenes]
SSGRLPALNHLDKRSPVYTEDAPCILFPKITHSSWFTPVLRHPELIRFIAASTVMNEALFITLAFLIMMAIIVVAVLYLERRW